jgi:hypothetical protein
MRELLVFICSLKQDRVRIHIKNGWHLGKCSRKYHATVKNGVTWCLSRTMHPCYIGRKTSVMAHTTGSHPYLAHKARYNRYNSSPFFCFLWSIYSVAIQWKLSRHKNTDSVVVLVRVLELTGDASPAISVYLRQCPVAATPARTIACFEEGGDRAGQRLRRGRRGPVWSPWRRDPATEVAAFRAVAFSYGGGNTKYQMAALIWLPSAD